MYKIQVLHFSVFMNTNHASEDLESLKSLLQQPSFAGRLCQIVDHGGTVHFGPVRSEGDALEGTENFAEVLGVPVLDPHDWRVVRESHGDASDDLVFGYTLQAVHEEGSEPIVSLRLEEAQALEIMRELWADVDFWAAPGGGSIRIESMAEAEAINRILGNCWITYQPARHRWHFHVHLM